MPNNIPRWLNDGKPDPDQAKLNLIPSRDEMYKALELYYTHVKHVMMILFSLLTALFAILGLSTRLNGNLLEPQVIKAFVGVFLSATFPIGILAIFILRRYYEVYVSALIFAVRVHLATDMHTSHSWFSRTIEQARRWTSVKSDADFLKRRAISPSDTFILYSCIIGILSVLSLSSGVILLCLPA